MPILPPLPPSTRYQATGMKPPKPPGGITPAYKENRFTAPFNAIRELWNGSDTAQHFFGFKAHNPRTNQDIVTAAPAGAPKPNFTNKVDGTFNALKGLASTPAAWAIDKFKSPNTGLGNTSLTRAAGQDVANGFNQFFNTNIGLGQPGVYSDGYDPVTRTQLPSLFGRNLNAYNYLSERPNSEGGNLFNRTGARLMGSGLQGLDTLSTYGLPAIGAKKLPGLSKPTQYVAQNFPRATNTVSNANKLLGMGLGVLPFAGKVHKLYDEATGHYNSPEAENAWNAESADVLAANNMRDTIAQNQVRPAVSPGTPSIVPRPTTVPESAVITTQEQQPTLTAPKTMGKTEESHQFTPEPLESTGQDFFSDTEVDDLDEMFFASPQERETFNKSVDEVTHRVTQNGEAITKQLETGEIDKDTAKNGIAAWLDEGFNLSEAYENFTNMGLPGQLMVGAGVSIGLYNLLNSILGEGGVGSLLLSALGLGGAYAANSNPELMNSLFSAFSPQESTEAAPDKPAAPIRAPLPGEGTQSPDAAAPIRAPLPDETAQPVAAPNTQATQSPQTTSFESYLPRINNPNASDAELLTMINEFKNQRPEDAAQIATGLATPFIGERMVKSELAKRGVDPAQMDRLLKLWRQ